jgi:hypothetical protein
MELKYLIVYGFNSEQQISIDADELEKAYALFMLGGRAIFKSGDAVDAKYIQAIRPDYHSTMGWAKDWKLGADDYNQLNDSGVDKKLRLTQARAKTRVEYLIANNQQALIGKNVPIPELESDVTVRGGSMKSIGELMK